MRNMIQAIIGLLLLIIFVSVSQSTGYAQSKAPKKDSQLLKRIDFNNAYIMGQAIKSGAVYLLNRKNSDIKSMIKYRTSYRDEILEDFHVPELKKNMQQDNESVNIFSIDLNFSHNNLQ
jgi:hypothetical protein